MAFRNSKYALWMLLLGPRPNQKSSDLIEHLPSIREWDHPEGDASHNPLVVFLLTPTFTSLLRHDATFLTDALQRLFPDTETSATTVQRCTVLAAVVDRLPSSVTRSDISETRLDGIRAKIDGGIEGLGFMLAPRAVDAAPGLFQGLDFKTELHDADLEHRGCLSFMIDSQDRRSTVEVPLAETIFQNGSSSTMVASEWARSARSEKWLQQGKAHTSSQQVNLLHSSLSTLGRAPQAALDQSMGIPLMPLTKARQITEGFGNIIRKLQGGDAKSDTFPASQELERSLGSHFKAIGLEQQAVTIWAILYPEGNINPVDPDHLLFTDRGMSEGVPNPVDPQSRMLSHRRFWLEGQLGCLCKGASLRRVLGGGGGWGHNQGLISLDHETRYGTTDSAMSTGLTEDDNVSFREDFNIGQLARPGDWVQFFLPSYRTLWSSRPISHEEGTAPAKTHDVDQESDSSLLFDVIPSSDDPSPLDHVKDTPRGKKCYVIENHFGASSSQGLSYTTEWRDPTETRKQLSQKPLTTRVDVPYSKILIRATSRKSDAQ
ncbi:MAG: hypothetical protein M1837_006732 [Sclerophora amabilis]|nr:MAG: hypothetical protein M1837_006732 [Sclerophora amabilis]